MSVTIQHTCRQAFCSRILEKQERKITAFKMYIFIFIYCTGLNVNLNKLLHDPTDFMKKKMFLSPLPLKRIMGNNVIILVLLFQC